MAIRVDRFTDLAAESISSLDRRMAEYYEAPPASYYQIADRAAGQYTPDAQPFHCDLVRRVRPGMSLLELGCGSAHLCPHVTAAGASYTGVDHSDDLLRTNRGRFPQARFFSVGAEMPEVFDIVASLYTIEHIVDPPVYLESMWNFCRPGGLIAIICPDFVDGEDFPPSFYYGKTPKRLREKLARAELADIGHHLVDLFWRARRWKRHARSAAPGAFWINSLPRVLHGAPYSIDGDAVHLPRLDDLVAWLRERGAAIVTTSRDLPGTPGEILRYNCYVLARKDGSASRSNK